MELLELRNLRVKCRISVRLTFRIKVRIMVRVRVRGSLIKRSVMLDHGRS